MGQTMEVGLDYNIITPLEKLTMIAIDTYDDHQMATPFSQSVCAEVSVTIKDPDAPAGSPQQFRMC
uniref:Uncharacterized protein n=1 Tax=Aegilops tauschii subsp. strangulata TaxID=200361 RepID=A0A453QKB3_AEGTS